MLVFFTGADCVPPLGFPPRPCLHFLGSDAMFPTASTCSLILRLPTCYSTYEAFKDAMIEGLTCNGGLDGGPRDGCGYLYPCTTIHGTFYMLLCNQLFSFGRCKYMHMYICTTCLFLRASTYVGQVMWLLCRYQCRSLDYQKVER